MKLLRAVFTLFFVLLLSSISYGQTLGSNTLIPEATCNSGVAATDLLCANSSDHTISVNPNGGTLQNIIQTFRITSAYTNATTSFTSVTGLSFPVSASRNYHAVCHIVWNASAATAGPNYQFTGPAQFTSLVTNVLSAVSATSFFTLNATTFSSRMNNSNSVFANTNMIDTITFDLINGTIAGTVQLQASAANTGTLTIQPGSACMVQ